MSTNRSRIPVALAIIGLTAVAAVAVVVFAFGREDPSPPSLADDPNPSIPGELLLAGEDSCVVRIPASGGDPSVVYCGNPDGVGQGYIQAWTWIDDRTVAYITSGKIVPGFEVIAVDIETREERVLGRADRLPDSFAWQPLAPDGTSAHMDGGTLVFTRSGVRTEVRDFDISSSASVRVAGWSPDSQWVAIAYIPPRGGDQELWLVSRDGETAGTLTEDMESHWISWRIDGVGVSPAVDFD